MTDANNTPRVYDLTKGRSRVAGIVALNGEQHDVLKLTGRQYQAVEQFGQATSVTQLYDMVQQIIPTMSHDDVLSLDAEQCAAILTLAGQGAAAVEKLFPNGTSPADPIPPG